MMTRIYRCMWSITVGLTLALTSGCGTTSLEDFEERVRNSKACSPGDTCVLAGAGACTCDSPVNASRAEELNEAAKRVDCRGTVVDCVYFRNPRCESGVCVADY